MFKAECINNDSCPALVKGQVYKIYAKTQFGTPLFLYYATAIDKLTESPASFYLSTRFKII